MPIQGSNIRRGEKGRADTKKCPVCPFLKMMKNIGPLVSVLMPVLNGGSFLPQAIDSILNQTYQNFELLIADDGSKDNTWEIINSYSSNKIKAFHFKKNIGAFPRTNFLYSKARGKILCVMDADDISKPDRLEKQIQFLSDNPKVIVVGGQVELIGEDGAVFGQKNVPERPGEVYRQFGFVHPMVHPSCLIRRSLLPKRKLLYRTEFGVNSDYHTFIELLQFGKFANLPDYVLQYRLHDHNTSFKNIKRCFLNTLQIRLLAVTKYNYRIDARSALSTLVQIPSILLMPDKFIDFLYPIVRGLKMVPSANLYEKVNPDPRFSFN